MKALIEGLRNLDLAAVRRGLIDNKQFVAIVLLGVLTVAFVRGEPAPSLLAGGEAGGGAPTVAAAATPTPEEIRDAVDDLIDAVSPPVVGGADDFGSPPGLPPAPPEPPAPTCASTDPIRDIYEQVQGPLSAALGAPAPGKALLTLAEIAAGCSDADPTGAVLDLALEFAPLVPDLGIPPIDLPDVPGVPPLPVPPEVVDALGPLSGAIRDGCSNLALISLVLIVLPPAIQSPIGSSDLIQFLAPASALCGLFDEEPAE
ncbi:MAG: hypothetical protein WD646_14465 [Actinomycetota bacterium]